MEKEAGRLQRYAGIGILILAALILLFIWRRSAIQENGQETAVSISATPTAQPILIGGSADQGEIITLEGINQAPLPILSDNSIAPAPIAQTYKGKLPQHQFETYTVKRGDTPAGIAYQFGIKTETLLGGNAQLSQEASLLQPDMVLTILPIDGVLHDVQQGDTLESISAEYGIPMEEIIAYAPNNLEFPYRLYPETQIMVPGAVREVFVWKPPDLSSVRGRSSSEGSGIAPLVVGTGTFIYPVSSSNFTQYYWYGHPGVDIALAEGSAVFAADTGTVTFAGWNIYGYGNLIVINHGNGFETFYGHLSSLNVGSGTGRKSGSGYWRHG